MLEELLLQIANKNNEKRLKVFNVRAGHRGYIVIFDNESEPSEYISYDEVLEYIWEELCNLKQSIN